jgi:hypothetical protein
VVSVTDPYGRILGFLDQSRYSFFEAAPHCTHEGEWTSFQKSGGSGTGFPSLVNTIEELLGRKSSGSGLETENTSVEICYADHMASSIRKSWP